MYRLLLILLMSFTFTQDICEGTCFSEEEVQNMFNNIKELQFDLEKSIEIRENLKFQIEDCDQIIMDYDEGMRLCEKQIKIKEDMIKTIKPKWYENKYLWFFGGVVLTSGSVFLAGQIK
jgi:hypothetical protein